jgi:hypothetical protein
MYILASLSVLTKKFVNFNNARAHDKSKEYLITRWIAQLMFILKVIFLTIWLSISVLRICLDE